MPGPPSVQVGQCFAGGDGQVRRVTGVNRWFCLYVQYSRQGAPRRGQAREADLLAWGRLVTPAEARQLAPEVDGLDAALDAQQAEEAAERVRDRDARQAREDDAFADDILRAVSDDVLLAEVRRRGLKA